MHLSSPGVVVAKGAFYFPGLSNQLLLKVATLQRNDLSVDTGNNNTRLWLGDAPRENLKIEAQKGEELSRANN